MAAAAKQALADTLRQGQQQCTSGQHPTMKNASATKVPAKRMLKYCRISQCILCQGLRACPLAMLKCGSMFCQHTHCAGAPWLPPLTSISGFKHPQPGDAT